MPQRRAKRRVRATQTSRDLSDDWDSILSCLLEHIPVKAICIMIMSDHFTFLFCDRNPRHLMLTWKGRYPASNDWHRCDYEEQPTGRGGTLPNHDYRCQRFCCCRCRFFLSTDAARQRFCHEHFIEHTLRYASTTAHISFLHQQEQPVGSTTSKPSSFTS